MTDKELDDLEARAGNAHGNDCRDGSHMDLIGELADAIAELRVKNSTLENQLLRTQSALVEVADKAPEGMMISGNAWCELSCSRQALKENTQ